MMTKNTTYWLITWLFFNMFFRLVLEEKILGRLKICSWLAVDLSRRRPPTPRNNSAHKVLVFLSPNEKISGHWGTQPDSANKNSFWKARVISTNTTTHPKIQQIINILTSTPCPNLRFLASMDFMEAFSNIEITSSQPDANKRLCRLFHINKTWCFGWAVLRFSHLQGEGVLWL